MPYAKRKLPNKRCWKVYNKETGRIYAKCTSEKKADAQLRLLRSLKE